MKFDKWTVGLTAAGVVSLGAVGQADESPLNTLVSGTSLSGYVDTSGIWKPGVNSSAARFINTAPDTFNGFNLNVFDLQIEKPLTEAQWSAGYKAQLWFGPDAAALPGSVFNNGNDNSNVAVKQAYVALRAPVGNGLDFKIGQWDTIIGYEVADSYANPNFSRSLGFWLEPLSHTGLQASYQVTEWLGLAGGIADTAFAGINVKDTKHANGAGDGTLTYMGAVTLKAPENWGWLAGSSLYAGIVDGGVSQGQDTLNYYVGASMPTPIKEITVGVSWDYLTGAAYEDSYAQAIAGYISWQLTEKLKVSGRAEYANSGYNAWAISGYGFSESEGTKLFAATLTLDYSLWANVITRVEVVWDHDLNGNDIFRDGGYDYEGYYNNYDGRNNSVLLAANVIYKF